MGKEVEQQNLTNDERLRKIFSFMKETDKFKLIQRTVEITNGIRKENDAEHSWHLSLFYMLLENDLPKGLDKLKLLKILIIHDLCEIYAGDTPLYDTLQILSTGELIHDEIKVCHKKKREIAGAKKLFGLLPEDLKNEFYSLWHEFEECLSLEARIAKTLDKLHPLIQNSVSDGSDYKQCGSTFRGESSLIEKYSTCNDTLRRMGELVLEDARHAGWIH